MDFKIIYNDDSPYIEIDIDYINADVLDYENLEDVAINATNQIFDNLYNDMEDYLLYEKVEEDGSLDEELADGINGLIKNEESTIIENPQINNNANNDIMDIPVKYNEFTDNENKSIENDNNEDKLIKCNEDKHNDELIKCTENNGSNIIERNHECKSIERENYIENNHHSVNKSKLNEETNDYFIDEDNKNNNLSDSKGDCINDELNIDKVSNEISPETNASPYEESITNRKVKGRRLDDLRRKSIASKRNNDTMTSRKNSINEDLNYKVDTHLCEVSCVPKHHFKIQRRRIKIIKKEDDDLNDLQPQSPLDSAKKLLKKNNKCYETTN